MKLKNFNYLNTKLVDFLLINLFLLSIVNTENLFSTTRLTRSSQLVKVKNESQKFLRQPDDTTLVIGKRLLLRCKPNLTNYIKILNEKNTNLVQYDWFKDNKPIEFNSRTNLYKDGSLEVNQASEQDTGFYKCIAKFRSLVYESRQAFVKINSVENKKAILPSNENRPKTTPKFYLWPDDRNVQEDEEVIFECLAQNDANVFNDNLNRSSPIQTFKYQWIKDGVALDLKTFKNKRLQIVQGYSLRIQKVQETDAGTYTCRICNSDQDDQKNDFYDNKKLDSSDSNSERDECDERSGILKVLVSPRFIKRPSNLNITLKSDAELECSAYGVPIPTIQWFKNGEPIYPSEYFQFNSNQGNLKILGIISQDEGYYQCVASNELNTIQTVAQLTVTIDESSEDYYEENESSLNKLGIKSKKESISPSKLKSTNSPFNLETTSSIIHLSAPLSLKVLRTKSRSIQLEWSPPAIVRTETNANLNSLSYSINWKAKNLDRQRELSSNNTSILIDELTPDTIYLIYVSAVMSSIKGPYSLIETKTEPEALMPGPPIDFKAELIDFNAQSESTVSSLTPTLKFKWRKPNLNPENIVKYRLYYQHLNYGPRNKKNLNQTEFQPNDFDSETEFEQNEEFNSNEEFEFDLNSGKSSDGKSSEKYIDIDIPSELNDSDHYYEFLLEDLQKYSTYKFRLVAIDKNFLQNKPTKSQDNVYDDDSSTIEETDNENYLNQNSAEIIIETPSDVPDGPPENLQIETLNTTSVQLQWNLPAIEKRNGLIIGYKIAVKENDKQVWHSNVDSEPRRKIISGLLPGHKYSFRLTAKTVNGTGPASEWIIAETFSHEMDESKVPGQPVEINAEPTDKTIVIQWLPPLNVNSTLVRKFLLKYGIGYPDTEIEIPGNRNSYIINNLIPSSQYVISLRAVNNAGYGMEILKDVVTKRKSALGENENLFPPLNVQAVAISSQSIEVRWTDWHLKPEEQIPDDRIYTVRYNIADNSKYKFKNASERNVIITDLKPNTLYDFSVRLVINRRESDWSMTTSQMTMETSPAPSDIIIISDPSSPNNVVISWVAPNLPLNSDSSLQNKKGYIISYLDEKTIKQNSNYKWKNEIVTTINSNEKLMKHTVRKLNLETVYYFKIQVRNNRAYGASSPTVIFKTPNAKGEGGGKIFTPPENPEIVLNKADILSFNKSQIDMNFIWMISAGVSTLFLVVVILVSVLICKKTNSNKENRSNDKNTFNRNTLNSSKRALKSRQYEQDDNLEDDTLQQQQQLLVNNLSSGTNKTDLIAQSQINSQAHLISCSNSSNTSTLLKQQRTPHHQPLMINNPNHMMMNVMNPLSISNNNDVEFYSNMNTQQIFTNNSHANSDTTCYNTQNYQFEHHIPNQNSFEQQISNNYSHSIRNGSINEETTDLTNSVLQAANAAFNSSLFNNANSNFISNNFNQLNNEPSFLRHTIRPKPIAIPINSNTNSNQLNLNPIEQQSMFSINNPARKSFKNLPIATATLIPNQTINFNDSNKQINGQKLQYTARPYIIDNQVQSGGEYSNHSPASSSHSGGQSQLYDKIANINTSNTCTKSLLQPLKSFASSNVTNSHHQFQSSSMSIPNTPAKFSENMNINTKSPAKKQLLVSLASNSTSASITRINNNNNQIMGKSIENIYDKKLNTNNEELTAEMANLEGIMKDLNAITAQQFEC